MSATHRTRWDERYRHGDWADLEKPASILEDAVRWLPPGGRALDLACGAGRNAVHLARQGFRVLAVDLSVEGLRILRRRAEREHLDVQPVLADLRRFAVRPGTFQIVVNTHFLLRETFPLIRRALAPGGLLLFETFSVDEIEVLGGDVRRAFAVERGELADTFSEMEVLRHEEGVFDRPEGERGLARLIARHPGSFGEASGGPGFNPSDSEGSGGWPESPL